MKNIIYTFFLFILSFSLSFAQSADYSRIKIDLTQTSLAELALLGLEIDHGHHAHHRHLVNDYSATEIALLDANGIDYQVLIRDVKTWYKEGKETGQAFQARLKNGACDNNVPISPYATPDNYEYGSMGGYLTLDEAFIELDKMATSFPNLIQQRTPIENILTHEGREIYWLRISDNPGQDEAEPEILYTALHHAREPNGLSQMIFYMWYLLENYNTDAEVKYLVDHTEMYFIPIVNPDGYVYNESIEPNGGGLWRKNRWVDPSTGNTRGVDLNRNYGYEWAHDDSGSSPNPGSQTYRGPAPFSEPETQAVKALCEAHEFQIALNYHTYGNLLIQPWGYSDSPSPDDASFDALAEIMTRENNFVTGTGTETVGYTVNGDSDDWMYGEETTKPKIFAMTPEVGSGFWPNQASIDPFNKTCMLQNLAAAHLLLNYVEVENEGPDLLTDVSGAFDIQIKKYGLMDGAVNVSVSAGSPNLTITPPVQESINISHLQQSDLRIEYQLNNTDNPIQELLFDVTIDNGQYAFTSTLSKTIILGETETVLLDAADELTNWSNSAFGDWDITNEDFYSSPTSITDSPEQEYENNAESILSLNETILLPAEALSAFMQFRGKWDIESGYDFVQLNLELVDSGLMIPLCGKYTNIGTEDQLEGEPLYDGVQSEWVWEQIDLTPYLGQTIKFHFNFESDGFVTGDGFYFDDFEVVVYNEIPVSTKKPILNSQRFRAFPNPFSTQLNIHLSLNETSPVQIELVNHLGQVIAIQAQNNFSAGEHQINWDLPELSTGVYTLVLTTGNGDQLIRKIVKQK